MLNGGSFSPAWASPPGETIRDLLHSRGISLQAFSEQMDQPPHAVAELLAGVASLTSDAARKLEMVLGSTASFWLAREQQYRRDLVVLQEPANPAEDAEWLAQLPVADMVRLGWVSPASRSRRDRLRACLDFFDVPDVKSWKRTYGDLVTAVAFRTSQSFESQPAAVAAWLRRGELEADAIQCEPWNPTRFRDALARIRGLTRIKDPQLFVPKLKSECASCGVAVAIVPTPTGCRASGATCFLSPEKALLMLSFRYRSDDHFWFTFFHEAGHLLLHEEAVMFLEGTDMVSGQEDEANSFASEMLVPSEFLPALVALPANFRAVVRFARRLGVSPGIVVGQLQHRRVLRRDQLNFLKNRFVWVSG